MLTNITPKEAAELIAHGAGVIDVRTKEEFANGHIKDAINIDIYGANFENELTKLDKTKPYVVNCQSGGRSSKAVEVMGDLGFVSACNLMGGVMAWKKEENPLEA